MPLSDISFDIYEKDVSSSDEKIICQQRTVVTHEWTKKLLPDGKHVEYTIHHTKGHNGELITRYSNHRVYSQYTYLDGKKHGCFKICFKDGRKNRTAEKIHISGQYWKGVRHGTISTFNRKGDLEITRSYLYGVRHGPYITYHPNNVIHTVYHCINGKPVGSFREYDAKGHLVKEQELGKGKRLPLSIKRRYRRRFVYVDGGKTGTLKEYDDNDNLVTEVQCVKNKTLRDIKG